MSTARPILWCATGVALGGIAAIATVDVTGRSVPSPWWSMLTFSILGALFALCSRRDRWWVALGFVWLTAAWVEAGQAVFQPDSGKARVEDLVIGCIGGTVGVAAVVLLGRYLAHRRAAQAPAVAAPVPVVAAPSAPSGAAAAPRFR